MSRVLSASFFLALSLMFGVMWVQMSVPMTVFRLLFGAAVGGAAGYLVAAPLTVQSPAPPRSPLTRGRLLIVLASLTLQALLIWGAATGRVFTWRPFRWLTGASQAIPDSWSGIFGATPRVEMFPEQCVAWWTVGFPLRITMPGRMGWRDRYACQPAVPGAYE